MFKECLMNDVVPFIIDEEHKWYYYRGLKEWNKEKGYLTDTCLSCQDKYKEWLCISKSNIESVNAKTPKQQRIFINIV